jgi:hypothetical protein
MSNLFVALLITVILIALAVSKALETSRRDRIYRSVIDKTNAALERHSAALAEKRTQLAHEKWSEEIRYFLLDHVRPVFSREELDFLHQNFANLALAVERAFEAVMLEQKTAVPSTNITSRADRASYV